MVISNFYIALSNLSVHIELVLIEQIALMCTQLTAI